MDMNKLMEMATKMKAQLESAQSDAANQKYRGESGGGMVAITINGRHDVLEVKIDQSAMADIRLLEDLVRAAMNAALTTANDSMKNRMNTLAAAAGFDPSMMGGM